MSRLTTKNNWGHITWLLDGEVVDIKEVSEIVLGDVLISCYPTRTTIKVSDMGHIYDVTSDDLLIAAHIEGQVPVDLLLSEHQSIINSVTELL